MNLGRQVWRVDSIDYLIGLKTRPSPTNSLVTLLSSRLVLDVFPFCYAKLNLQLGMIDSSESNPEKQIKVRGLTSVLQF